MFTMMAFIVGIACGYIAGYVMAQESAYTQYDNAMVKHIREIMAEKDTIGS